MQHPLIQHKLTLMRRRDTNISEFRSLMKETSLLLAYEVTRELPMTTQTVETPLSSVVAPILVDEPLVVISIMRAGQGILDGILELMPSVQVGHIGLYREPRSLAVVEYYFKVPSLLAERDILVVDPMLATGNTASTAISRLKQAHPKSIRFLCLLAAQSGIDYFHEDHPDVPVYTAAIDPELSPEGDIVPGLGDASDRLFGTK